MPRTLLACLALTSCTWVTPGEVLDKLQWLDDDDDGVPNGEDCAPASASEGGAAEVPYDGLDNDCADGDALDLDGDGWPGVDQATWEARRDAAGGSGDWPVTLGARVDCDDTDPAVRPDATEIFYDGARTRCDTAHDFDADGDGWISDAWDGTPELAAWDAAWPDAPGEPGDCDDADDRVHPGADDPPYDGKDADCGYDNDFDADGDGYVADGDGLWAAFLVYRSRPGYGEVPGEPGDCLDVDRPFDGAVAIDLPNICSSTEPTLRAGAVQAHLVHPGACDLRQDGVDADCAGDDDFDFDEDGWYPDALAEDRARYAAAWGYTLTDPGGDCDDDDREIHPGAEEAIGDAVDQDCDGGPYGASTTPIHWLDGSYTAPSAPSLAATVDGVTLAVGAAAASGPGWSAGSSSAFAHALAGAPVAPWSSPAVPTTWSTGGAGVAVLRALGDGDLAQILTTALVGGRGELALTPVAWDPTLTPSPLDAITDSAARASTPGAAPATADLWAAPDGRWWWIACRAGELTVVTTRAGVPTATRTTVVTPASAACSGGGCVLGPTCAIVPDEDDLYAATCTTSACDLLRLTASGTALPQVTPEAAPGWPGLTALRRTGGGASRAIVGAVAAGGVMWIHPDDPLAYTARALSGRRITELVGLWHAPDVDVWTVESDGAVDTLSLARIGLGIGNDRRWPWRTADAATPRLHVDAIDQGPRTVLGVVESGAQGRTGYASVLW